MWEQDTQTGACRQLLGRQSPAEPSPLTTDSEDEAFLILSGHVQGHARVRARAGKLQVRELQHLRAWKKQRAESQGRLEQDQVWATSPAS